MWNGVKSQALAVRKNRLPSWATDVRKHRRSLWARIFRLQPWYSHRSFTTCTDLALSFTAARKLLFYLVWVPCGRRVGIHKKFDLCIESPLTFNGAVIDGIHSGSMAHVLAVPVAY